MCLLCQEQCHVGSPSHPLPGQPRATSKLLLRRPSGRPQLFGFPFFGVQCGLFQCLKSSFRFHFLKWASEGLFLLRQSPVGWGSGVCVQQTREVVHHLPASGMLLLSSAPFSLHLLLVFTRLLQRACWTESLGLSLGCWCSEFHQGLNYVLRGSQRNWYAHRRASLSQRLQLSGI